LVFVIGSTRGRIAKINYGTGNDVSEESIADGRIPLKIRWYNDSYIEIPVHGRRALTRRAAITPVGAGIQIGGLLQIAEWTESTNCRGLWRIRREPEREYA